MTGLGRLAHRPVHPDADAPLLHAWVTHPKGAFWEMADADVAAVRAAYAEIDAAPHHRADLGLHEAEPAFLFERYDPAHDPVGEHLDPRPGDLGMHLLTAPTDRPVHGFTTAVMRHVLDACFADPQVQRVVVEPDVRNAAVRRLNVAAGFTELREVGLPGKRAQLSTLTRDDHERSTR